MKKVCKTYRTQLKEKNIHIMGIPEGKEKETGTESIFKAVILKTS